MKSISIRFNEIPSDEFSKMPQIMELVGRVDSIAKVFGFVSKFNIRPDGFGFDFCSDNECSALLFLHVANNVLDYLQKNGFLSVRVRYINFY